MERREVAMPGTPVRPLVEELGTGEDQHEERARLRPLEQVLDEFEKARVGPLHVLEHEDGGVRVREPLEEEPPGGEEIVALVRRLLLGDSEQAREQRLDERRSSGSSMCSVSVASSFERAMASSSSSEMRARMRTMSASAQ